MPTQKSSPVSATEAKALFSDLDRLPALLLAVSGGPDSTALMVLAARWRDARKVKPRLIAVTVDHGLRAESKREAASVARLARKLRIPHRILRWTGKKPKTGLQQAARQARYRLLAQAARKANASHILTAHTLDDQAETVLIRMSRGSGMTGLAAMARISPLPEFSRTPSPHPNSGSPEFGNLAWPKSDTSDFGSGQGWGGGYKTNAVLENLPSSRPPSPSASAVDLPLKGGGEEKDRAPLYLVRPLLDIPKSRLVATLRAAKITFAEDPSNRDPRFTRARLRGLMPALAREGLDARRLALLARRLKRADRAIEAAVDRAQADLGADSASPGAIAFDATGYSRLPAEIALRLIGRAVAKAGDEGPVELGKLEALMSALLAALDAAQNAGQKTAKVRFRRSLAGAIVTLASCQIAVERAPPRRGRALTTGRRGNAKRAKTR